jgi:hypothetical protein
MVMHIGGPKMHQHAAANNGVTAIPSRLTDQR